MLYDVQELNQLRRAGVRNFDEGDVYEAEQRKKAAEGQKVAGGPSKYAPRASADDSLLMSQVK